MFKICLFDLDETLIRTDDLEAIRFGCKNNTDPERLQELKIALDSRDLRHIYSVEILNRIRKNFPDLKLGVFTRSPRSYAQTVLNWAYPGFTWDIVIAYEDVKRTKPYGDGIDLAMERFSVKDLNRVIVVGDGDVDVRSAYNCGCMVTLDQGAWPFKWATEHWNAVQHVPDAIISSPLEILEVLANPSTFLPELERLLDCSQPLKRQPRFDKINHFIPRSVGGDNTAYPIFVCGRSFSNYESVKWRKKWHSLTQSVGDNKDSDIFPEEWVKAIRAFIKNSYATLFKRQNIVVTVIPHRPGRKPRLEKLLKQLELSIKEQPIPNLIVTCQPALLAYRAGVKSQHNDLLDHDARFINVRDHLFVQQQELVNEVTSFLVIDDVTTTGSSLIFANKFLKTAGATDVKCLSMAKNISKIL